jgi:hypothetical protein
VHLRIPLACPGDRSVSSYSIAPSKTFSFPDTRIPLPRGSFCFETVACNRTNRRTSLRDWQFDVGVPVSMKPNQPQDKPAGFCVYIIPSSPSQSVLRFGNPFIALDTSHLAYDLFRS